MKTFRKIAGSLVAVMAVMSLTSCSDEDDCECPAETLNFSDYAINYNADNYWSDCYSVTTGDAKVGDFRFTHAASEFSWDGVTYSSWAGFCPSRVNDTADYGPNDWIAHQWAAITGGGVDGKGTPYMIGDWATSAENPDPCIITYNGGKEFRPVSVCVTNNTYGYYCMKNGSMFSKAFTADDWCILTITGINATGELGHVDVYLAKDGKLLDTWQQVDLSGLGMVQGLKFTMSSSDTGDWGMNNPAYFCLDKLKYII